MAERITAMEMTTLTSVVEGAELVCSREIAAALKEAYAMYATIKDRSNTNPVHLDRLAGKFEASVKKALTCLSE